MRSIVPVIVITLATPAAADAPCTTPGYNGKPENVEGCVNGKNDTRTITCMPGFTVGGSTGRSVTLPMGAAFRGCVASDMCAAFGFSGKPANVKQCVNSTGKRTITCMDGFNVMGTTAPTVTLAGAAPFTGCVTATTKLCARTNDGTKPNVRLCVDGPNTRTINCAAGFVVTGTTNASITLTGDAPFPGCSAKR